jgi:hypothetical protein
MSTNKESNTPKVNQVALDPTIEELAVTHLVPQWVMNGVKKFYGWGIGKRLPEKDFLEKVDAWKNGPLDGKGVKK